MCNVYVQRIYVSYWYVRRDSYIRVTWLNHLSDVTHLYVQRDLIICTNTYLTHAPIKWICATWLIRMFDVTDSYVWRDLFVCATWLNYIYKHIFDTHSHIFITGLDSLICVKWQMYMTWLMCVVWLISEGNWRVHTCDVTRLCDMTHV